jgi:hypothetical protein
MACATGSSVNRFKFELYPIDSAQCEKTILSFKLIFNDKNDSEFNISPTIGLKITKSAL